MSRGVTRFTDLRAWQACRTCKLAVYRLVLQTPLSRDWRRRDQLEKSVAERRPASRPDRRATKPRT